jgi:uncharacterized membrane protein
MLVGSIRLTSEKNVDENNVKELILKILKKRKPESVEELINFVKSEIKIDEEKIISIYQELEEEKKTESHELIFPVIAKDYLMSAKALWFWLVAVFSALGSFFSLFADSFFPAFLQNIFGLILVLFLPGFVLVKTLYPITVPFKTRSVTLDIIERLVLSVGLSIVISSFLGYILYYTPWNLNKTAQTLSLLFFINVLSVVAIWREYTIRRSLFIRRVRKNVGYFRS